MYEFTLKVLLNKGSKKVVKKDSKKVVKKDSKKAGSCSKQTTKKYTSRSSPPYPANECCNKVKVGNDGKKYKSSPDKNGTCRWKKL